MLPTLTLERDGKSNSTLPALAQPQFGVPTPEVWKAQRTPNMMNMYSQYDLVCMYILWIVQNHEKSISDPLWSKSCSRLTVFFWQDPPPVHSHEASFRNLAPVQCSKTKPQKACTESRLTAQTVVYSAIFGSLPLLLLFVHLVGGDKGVGFQLSNQEQQLRQQHPHNASPWIQCKRRLAKRKARMYVMIEIDRILCLASEQLLSESANFESCIETAAKTMATCTLAECIHRWMADSPKQSLQ